VFVSVDLDSTESSEIYEEIRNSSASLDWDNYGSNPDLTGSPWSQVNPLEPIYTQVFYNSDLRRGRIKSFSESEIDQVTHMEPAMPSNDEEDQFCFPTRVFFRRIRESLSRPTRQATSSRSMPTLVTEI
jgi:hypothetical protein